MRLTTIPDPYAGGKHDIHKSHHDVGTKEFIGVDGEGITLRDGSHRYVLLGIGDDQIEDPGGLHWTDIFDFLYSKYVPRTAFTGFYLGYDFTQWLKSLPESRARRLLTIEGRAGRKSTSPALRGKYLPVDIDGWQIDMLGHKRFMLRKKPCECMTVKCEHPKGPWQYICDAGPFFQTSFLNVINPENWQKPILSQREYDTIVAGKELRSTAVLDSDMRRYNALENEVMSRVMHDLNDGFQKLEVNLAPSQWYGPGQAAQSWLKGRAPKREEVQDVTPDWFADAARASYFGGWFEIMAHGIIPGVSHEYDINSAYPYIISQLPCLLHGTYERGAGKPPTIGGREICLVRATVWGAAPRAQSGRRYVGAMLHRDSQGRISRPVVSEGWYWLHELEAAQKAKMVSRITADRFHEWVLYRPCDCLPPIRSTKHLYQMRLDVGKKTSLGKSAKLIANSEYGKFAQSIGLPQFANPVYASLITSGCRTMILDAIGTHPKGKSNVLMVATDGVYFIDPHPLLTVGKGLGEWEHNERRRLTLFKPGVYWDDDTRDKIAAGEHASFKARGVSARDFSKLIAQIDKEFQSWGTNVPTTDPTLSSSSPSTDSSHFPSVSFTSSFAMVTALQALVRNDWESAGTVNTAKPLTQDSNPADKRQGIYLDHPNGGRPIYRSEPYTAGRNAKWRHAGNMSEWDFITEEDFSSVPYEKKFGMEDPFSDESEQAFGVSPDENRPLIGFFRVLTGQE